MPPWMNMFKMLPFMFTITLNLVINTSANYLSHFYINFWKCIRNCLFSCRNWILVWTCKKDLSVDNTRKILRSGVLVDHLIVVRLSTHLSSKKGVTFAVPCILFIKRYAFHGASAILHSFCHQRIFLRNDKRKKTVFCSDFMEIV